MKEERKGLIQISVKFLVLDTWLNQTRGKGSSFNKREKKKDSVRSWLEEIEKSHNIHNWPKLPSLHSPKKKLRYAYHSISPPLSQRTQTESYIRSLSSSPSSSSSSSNVPTINLGFLAVWFFCNKYKYNFNGRI